MAATSPETRLAILAAAGTPGRGPKGDVTRRSLAEAAGVSHDTVQRLLARYGPVSEALRSLKRDHFLGAWQWLFLDTLQALTDQAQDGKLTWRDRKDAAITMGIATEKSLLLAGQPTQIVAGLHELRVSLPELAGRMAGVAQRIGRSSTVAASLAPAAELASALEGPGSEPAGEAADGPSVYEGPSMYAIITPGVTIEALRPSSEAWGTT